MARRLSRKRFYCFQRHTDDEGAKQSHVLSLDGEVWALPDRLDTPVVDLGDTLDVPTEESPKNGLLCLWPLLGHPEPVCLGRITPEMVQHYLQDVPKKA